MIIKDLWIKKVIKALRDSKEDFLIRKRTIINVHFIVGKSSLNLSSFDHSFYDVQTIMDGEDEFIFAKIAEKSYPDTGV